MVDWFVVVWGFFFGEGKWKGEWRIKGAMMNDDGEMREEFLNLKADRR